MSIRNVDWVRGKCMQAVNSLRVNLTFPAPDGAIEREALVRLGGQPLSDEASFAEAVDCLMRHLGCAPSAVKDKRFDKTRRAVARARLKGPRRLTASTVNHATPTK